MGNTDVTQGGATAVKAGNYGLSWLKKYTFSFAADNAGAADSFDIINLPAGTIVKTVIAEVTTTETATVDIGTAVSGEAATWFNDLTLASAVRTVSPVTNVDIAAATTLRITCNTSTTTAAIIDVWVEGIGLAVAAETNV